MGGVLGLIRGSFLVFIIFVILLLVSKTNESLNKTMKESMSVNVISTYLYGYSDMFPEFIQETLKDFKETNDETNFKNEILEQIENNEKTEGGK